MGAQLEIAVRRKAAGDRAVPIRAEDARACGFKQPERPFRRVAIGVFADGNDGGGGGELRQKRSAQRVRSTVMADLQKINITRAGLHGRGGGVSAEQDARLSMVDAKDH